MTPADNIRTILIDDEAQARDVLSILLLKHPEVAIVAVANDADAGLEQIVKHRPDLVFLDIQMPRKTGFDLIAELRSLNLQTAVVFVTAYDEYAIRAFKVAAFDYLLKPIDPFALSDTLRRYTAMRSVADFNQKVDHLLHHLHHDDRIRMNTRAGFLLIDPMEILYATADGNYTVIHFSALQSEVVTMNIGTLFELLPAGHFSRISRSAMINRSFLYRVDRKKRICELRKDGANTQLDVSAGFIRKLE
ncbi:MAG: LytTR family DNA-binding domain-containing protein [Bacteroidetes bacterium]|nr:LytTR family DNA-binding domain-containing protein [Bacteroidota bacterium]